MEYDRPGVLLIEDDEDDYVMIRGFLSDTYPAGCALEWVKTFGDGLEAMQHNHHDVCLLDYRLGERDGIELLQEASKEGYAAPIILLTGHGNYELDVEAMRAGAADYLSKEGISADLLERSIRYSIEHKRAERKMRRLNRTLKMLSECNRALVHAADETELLHRICGLIVEPGGYRLAWIGFADHDEAKSVRPVAQCGYEDGYLATMKITWADTERGRGPTGTAIRTGKPRIARNFMTDPDYAPWRAEALRRGYGSSAALPLVFKGEVFGALNIYAVEPDGFDDEEMKLLMELTESLSYGIAALRTREGHKRAEVNLKKERDFNRTLVQASPAFFVAIDRDGKTLMMNDAMLRALGYSSDEVVGTDYLMSFIHEEDREHVSGVFERIVIHREDVADEGYILRRDGRKLLIEWHGKPVLNEKEEVEYFFGMGIDITERRKAEETLRESERYFRSLLAHMHEDIYVIDRDYTIRDVNKEFVVFAGRRREEMVRHHCYEALHGRTEPCSRDGKKCMLEEVFRNCKPCSARYEYTRRDGSKVWADSIFSPLKDEQGNVTHVINSVRDVTREVKLEKQLGQAQKMEAVGTLAGGIAHDFNNILGIILGYTDLTLFNLQKGTPGYDNLQQVTKASHRAKELVRQILAFSRKSEQERQPLQIGPIVKEALKLLRAALPSTIEIRQEIETSSGEDTILADATQVHQIIMNLCTNADHAMQEKGGLLEVGLSIVELDSMNVALYPELSPGKYVRLTVSDTGHGIDPTIMSRIFDPYFTTKEVGEGTGLGLAVIHGIAKSYGGSVTAYSEPGRGATFHVYFPRMEKEAISEAEPVTPLSRGTEHILLIDDEPQLLKAGKTMLEYLGYRVTAFTSSLEALEAFRSGPDAFDLAITDQTMPKMTGLELARKLVRVRSAIPVILCTGYSSALSGITAEELKSIGIREVALKPLIMSDIARSIRRVLDEK